MSLLLLSANQLSFRLESRWLWQHVNCEIFEGDRVALVGPSGSGKTVLLRTLAALEPLQQGRICFGDRDLLGWDIPQYRSQVMYLSQRPCLPESTVEGAIREPLNLKVHCHKQYDRDLVLGHLKDLNRSPEFLTKHTNFLSGGERQIVAFLRALMLQPKLLLLDEPTASLDESATASIEAAIASWMDADPGRACVWTSHNPAQLERVTTRQIHL